MSRRGARRPILGLDGTVHGPTRLAILWALYHRGESGYGQLEEATEIPRGRVCAQALRLGDAGLVKVRNARRNRRSVTLVKLTPKGHRKLMDHAEAYGSMQRGTPFEARNESAEEQEGESALAGGEGRA